MFRAIYNHNPGEEMNQLLSGMSVFQENDAEHTPVINSKVGDNIVSAGVTAYIPMHICQVCL